jgi:hypothetical protein
MLQGLQPGNDDRSVKEKSLSTRLSSALIQSGKTTD